MATVLSVEAAPLAAAYAAFSASRHRRAPSCPGAIIYCRGRVAYLEMMADAGVSRRPTAKSSISTIIAGIAGVHLCGISLASDGKYSVWLP